VVSYMAMVDFDDKMLSFQATKMLWNDSNGVFCMECDPVKQSLFLNVCNTSNVYQKWEWGALNRTMLDGWETMGSVLV
jgi:hypothetical protein